LQKVARLSGREEAMGRRADESIAYEETKARVGGTLDNSSYGRSKDALRGALSALVEWADRKEKGTLDVDALVLLLEEAAYNHSENVAVVVKLKDASARLMRRAADVLLEAGERLESGEHDDAADAAALAGLLALVAAQVMRKAGAQ
jgi:hypothetical protein